MNSIRINGEDVTEVWGASIEEIYRVYNVACKRAIKFFKENCIVSQSEMDFRPLEVLLCVNDDEVFFTCDFPWVSDVAMSEELWNSKRVDIMYCEARVINPDECEGYPYDDDGNIQEGYEESDVEEWENWLEEYPDTVELEFRDFEDVVEELLR